jgi:Tol biopolymer transport system component/tRNA A-37 threonylcarbamoyl transferase component Bud32
MSDALVKRPNDPMGNVRDAGSELHRWTNLVNGSFHKCMGHRTWDIGRLTLEGNTDWQSVGFSREAFCYNRPVFTPANGGERPVQSDPRKQPGSERWRRVEALYHLALERPQNERAAFLDDACGADEFLRREVESLLGYTAEAEDFMEMPATGDTLDSETLEGRNLGSYEVLSLLGIGGMGKVYLAKDTRLARTVAIKVLASEKLADTERKRRFLQEARAASALNHPNIVTVYDIASDSGTDFLVMEYVPGQSLHKRITTKGLPLKEAIGYATQIVSALAAAHSAGIVHRDIKPANVLVTDKGQVKVVDFGLAKLSDSENRGSDSRTDAPRTMEGVILGTASYMSPEQAAGKLVDARSDIFAVGAVLYEMLTGRRAFDRGTVLATLGAVMYEEPAPLASLVKGITPDLERLVERCLRKDPGRRIQTMADLKVALEELYDSPTTTAVAVPVSSRPGKPWVPYVIAGVLGIAAIAGTLSYLARRDDTPALGALNFVRLTDMDGWEVLPSWNKDGTMIVFGNNKDGSMDLFRMSVASGLPEQITRTPWDEVGPRWSPDLRYLVFVADRGMGSRIYVMPALGTGGSERELADTGLQSPDHFSASLRALGATPWSPTSEELLYTKMTEAGGTAIWRINVVNQTPSALTKPGPGESDDSAAWSFDGDHIAFIRVTAGRGSEIWVARADGTDLKMVAENASPLGGPAWSADNRKILFCAQNQIWEVDVASKKLRRITNSPSFDWFPVLSGSGRLAYVKFDDHRVDIYSVGLKGKADPQRVTDSTAESFFPSYSKDGRSVVYQNDRTGRNDIYLKRLDRGGEERNLTLHPDEDLVPAFAPDGSDAIVFVSNRNGGKSHVWVMDSGGGSPRQLSARAVPGTGLGGWTAASVAPRWSPDGKRIGFIGVTETGVEALYVVDRDGSNEKHLLDNVNYFDWYRDERHIIFARHINGLSRIVGYDLDTKEETALVPYSALEPVVSPGGRSLLFTTAESHFSMNLWVLPLRPASNGLPLPAGKPAQLTDGRSAWHAHRGAWSPDGETVLFTRDSDQGDIYTIENYR